MPSNVEERVRSVDVNDARRCVDSLWQAVLDRIANKTEIESGLFYNTLIMTASCILSQLNEQQLGNSGSSSSSSGGGPTSSGESAWPSYCSFLIHTMHAYGTTQATALLLLWSKILQAVRRYPLAALPLLDDYLRCIDAQRAQHMRSLETAAAGGLSPLRSKRPPLHSSKGIVNDVPESHDAPPLPSMPDLEYKGTVPALAPALTGDALLRTLRELPRKMSFAHSNGVVHLKLCNPLPIPQCSFVTSGYCCDTCKQQGIHVAYQAMLYEQDSDAEKNGVVSEGDVRSDAQIADKSLHGFDMCLACAVHFYTQQRKQLFECIVPPYKPYAVGHVSAVKLHSVQYISHPHSYAGTPFSAQHSSPTCSEHGGRVSSASFDRSTIAPVHLPPPHQVPGGFLPPLPLHPPRTPSPQLSRSGPPSPPIHRGPSPATVVFSISIAPWRGRPIAWVLPASPSQGSLHAVGEPFDKLQPLPHWKSRVTTVAEKTFRHSTIQEGDHTTSSGSWTYQPSQESSSDFDARSVGGGGGGAVSLVAKPFEDKCVICLSDLTGDAPVIETKCKHWFHVECLEGYLHMAEDVCPLCRTTSVMPDVSVPSTLEKNTFTVSVHLTEEEASRPFVEICVGSLISRSGAYSNPTNIAAATCIRVFPNEMKNFRKHRQSSDSVTVKFGSFDPR